MAANRNWVSSIVRTAALAHCRAGRWASASPRFAQAHSECLPVLSQFPNPACAGRLSVPIRAHHLPGPATSIVSWQSCLPRPHASFRQSPQKTVGLNRRFHQVLQGVRHTASVASTRVCQFRRLIALVACSNFVASASSFSRRSISFLRSSICSGVALNAALQVSNNSRKIPLSGTSRLSFCALSAAGISSRSNWVRIGSALRLAASNWG